MMRLNTLTGALTIGALLAAASQASAQAPAPLETGYFHINIGTQGGSHDLTQAGTFPIYDEDATFGNAVKVGGGTLFDIGGGVRIFGGLYAGLSYAATSDKSDGTVTGSIPHPFDYREPFRPVNGSAAGLKHSENQVHIQALYRMPITESFDLGVFVGPTIFSVKQDVVSGITVSEVGKPYSSVNLAGITTERASKSAVGFNIGVDGTYLFTRRLGVGAMLRFAKGSVDVPSGSSGTAKLDVGGTQFGVGLRVRF